MAKPKVDEVEAQINRLFRIYRKELLPQYREARDQLRNAREGLKRTDGKSHYFRREIPRLEAELRERYTGLAEWIESKLKPALEDHAGTLYTRSGRTYQAHFNARIGSASIAARPAGRDSPFVLQFYIEDKTFSQERDSSRGLVRLEKLLKFQPGEGFERLQEQSGRQYVQPPSEVPTHLTESGAKRLFEPGQTETKRNYRPKSQPSERLTGVGV